MLRGWLPNNGFSPLKEPEQEASSETASSAEDPSGAARRPIRPRAGEEAESRKKPEHRPSLTAAAIGVPVMKRSKRNLLDPHADDDAQDAGKMKSTSASSSSPATADRDDMDVEDADRPRYIVVDTDAWKMYWDTMLALVTLFCAFEVPIRLSFGKVAYGWEWTADVVISLMFLIDLGVAFNTAYIDGRGIWVYSRAAIATRYLRGWFWIDAPSSVPVELIELTMSHSSDGESLAMLRLLRILRLLRLLRLLKVELYARKLEEAIEDGLGSDLKVLRIFKLILKLLLLAHFLACLWMALAVHVQPADAPSWLTEYRDGSAVDGTMSEQYLFAFHWALASLLGQDSSVQPYTDDEVALATAVSLLGALVFGYVIGEISTLIARLDRQASAVEERIDAIRQYMSWRALPRQLQVRVRRYYEHYYEKQGEQKEERDILEGLNPALRSEVVGHVLRATLGRLPIFKRFSMDFQIAVFPLLKPLVVEAGEVLFRKGAPAKELLFLLDGEVTILSARDNQTPVMRLRAVGAVHHRVHELVLLTPINGGEYASYVVEGCFGHTVLLGSRRPATYVAHTHCEILSIDKADIVHLFAADSHSAAHVCNQILRDHAKMMGIRDTVDFLRLVATPYGSELRAALLLQRHWAKYCERLACRHDETYKLILRHTVAGQTVIGRTSLAAAEEYQSFRTRNSLRETPFDHPGASFTRESSRVSFNESSVRKRGQSPPPIANAPSAAAETPANVVLSGGATSSADVARLEEKMNLGFHELRASMRRLQLSLDGLAALQDASKEMRADSPALEV